MRSVLRAWSVICPDVGYVQGQNFVAAAMLVICEHDIDETVTLCVLLLRTLPNDFFSTSLLGCRVEVGQWRREGDLLCRAGTALLLALVRCRGA